MILFHGIHQQILAGTLDIYFKIIRFSELPWQYIWPSMHDQNFTYKFHSLHHLLFLSSSFIYSEVRCGFILNVCKEMDRKNVEYVKNSCLYVASGFFGGYDTLTSHQI
ncbi:uncharacterized protein LOC107817592 [Nicotiana tabacum]|uniref:Uncharacterized protein LOC107817592 n=8 Tax=Nicotiana tabacum TaxID=4097 RepID=A0AC58TVC0_TOBAC